MKLDRLPLLLKGLMLMALALLAPAAAQARVQEMDRIVAIVNDDIILKSELDHKIQLFKLQMAQQQLPMPPEKALAKRVLDKLVMERLQMQMAASLGIRVDDNSLNQTMARLAQQNNLSLSDFRAVLEQDGFSYTRFREDIRAEMTLARVRQRQINNQVNVTAQEIDNYLAAQARTNSDQLQYHLAHILIGVPKNATPEQKQAAEKRAKEVMEQLRGGADFAQTAVSVSQGQRALEGGDLGWRKPSEVPSLFAKVITSLSRGELAGPIESPAGFHIVKLVDIRGDSQHMVTQYHVRHILIKPTDLVSQEDARRRLEQLRERIVNGEDFEVLARARSEDPASAVKGGDLGWVNPGEMVPEFEEAVKSLPSGQLSEPVKTRYGWHLIQVLGQRQRDNTNEFMRAQASEAIRARKVEEETQTWLRRLRDEAYVEYRLDEDAAP